MPIVGHARAVASLPYDPYACLLPGASSSLLWGIECEATSVVRVAKDTNRSLMKVKKWQGVIWRCCEPQEKKGKLREHVGHSRHGASNFRGREVHRLWKWMTKTPMLSHFGSSQWISTGNSAQYSSECAFTPGYLCTGCRRSKLVARGGEGSGIEGSGGDTISLSCGIAAKQGKGEGIQARRAPGTMTPRRVTTCSAQASFSCPSGSLCVSLQ